MAEDYKVDMAGFLAEVAYEEAEQQPDDITLHWLENVRGCLVGAMHLVTHCDGVGDPELTLEIAKAHATCCKVIESFQTSED